MLLGEYNHTVDTKGRVIVPAKFRDDLGVTFIVTKGFDSSLFIFSKTEWNKFEEKIRSLPMTNPSARSFSRFFLAGANEVELDKQGRINLPQNLLDYAGITKDVVVIGVSSRVEIWDKAKWENYTSEDNLDVDEIAIQMSNLGI
ncbi:MAG: division/cell wall cluster transcriptional repressor MraZ [Clostridia bacterium]|nr:division/cell wall cluster transcriptional repressor MraZ [Clostridia bacterium]